jgi:hypothetical protein
VNRRGRELEGGGVDGRVGSGRTRNGGGLLRGEKSGGTSSSAAPEGLGRCDAGGGTSKGGKGGFVTDVDVLVVLEGSGGLDEGNGGSEGSDGERVVGDDVLGRLLLGRLLLLLLLSFVGGLKTGGGGHGVRDEGGRRGGREREREGPVTREGVRGPDGVGREREKGSCLLCLGK